MPAGAPDLPLALQASAQGPLADVQAQAELSSPASGSAPVPASSPQAQIKARVTPWGDLPVPEAQASFRALDLAMLWPAAPQTSLSGSASVQPLPANTWRLQLDASNASPALGTGSACRPSRSRPKANGKTA